MLNWRQSTKNTKVELYSEATLWKMIRDLLQHLENKDHQHHKWRQQRSWISYPDCQGAQDKQLTQYLLVPRSKWKMHRRYRKFRSQNVQKFGYLYQKHKWPKSWSSTEDPVVLHEQNLYGPPSGRTIVGLEHGWGKVPNWECSFVNREKGLFLSVYVDDVKLAGKKQNLDPMWKVLHKEVDLGEPTSFLDYVYLGCAQRECKISKDIEDNHRNLCESRMSAGALEKLLSSEKLMVPWHGRSCKEMRGLDIAHYRTKRLITQSRNSMYWRPSIQRRRNRICWRIVKSVRTNCSEMHVFSTNR